jgi:hypothetical protein
MPLLFGQCIWHRNIKYLRQKVKISKKDEPLPPPPVQLVSVVKSGIIENRKSPPPNNNWYLWQRVAILIIPCKNQVLGLCEWPPLVYHYLILFPFIFPHFWLFLLLTFLLLSLLLTIHFLPFVLYPVPIYSLTRSY